MEDFAFNILETLNANQQLDMLRELGPKYGLDPENVVHAHASPPSGRSSTATSSCTP